MSESDDGLKPWQELILTSMYLEGIVFQDYKPSQKVKKRIEFDAIREIFPRCNSFEKEMKKLTKTYGLVDDHGKGLAVLSLNKHGFGYVMSYLDDFECKDEIDRKIREFIEKKLDRISRQRFLRHPHYSKVKKIIQEINSKSN
ncbi:MAG: hypothetical protein ISS48_04230 [Candidatus Aenigmarchaeota archaeon]|nr:hypothetical protein [Candidatus Aenigmarchaeota archaeon]